MEESQARQLVMLRRINSFVQSTDAIKDDIKSEIDRILGDIIDPEHKVDRDLLSCFRFMKSVLEAGRYRIDEFLSVLECLDYLSIFERAIAREELVDGKEE